MSSTIVRDEQGVVEGASVERGVFAAPWSPCIKAYPTRMRNISEESGPAFVGGHSVYRSHRRWRCQRGTQMPSVLAQVPSISSL
jgi:hypothetical protein